MYQDKKEEEDLQESQDCENVLIQRFKDFIKKRTD